MVAFVMKQILIQLFIINATILFAVKTDGAETLDKRIKDSHYLSDSFWIYNDYNNAKEMAKKQNKPLFITFRCVPCHNCKAFDAEVAQRNKEVADLAKNNFISVRLVEMKGIDLGQFQFDYDLNWAAMFLNSDGTVYARYGTQSDQGPDAYNSIDGLINTMKRVVKAHKNYPQNKSWFKEKKGGPVTQSNPLNLPGLSNPAKYARQTELSNCIHCHNIYDAIHNELYEKGKLSKNKLWKYPLPQNIGIEIDSAAGNVVKKVTAESAAGITGIREGDVICFIQEQRIFSIADIQWVLHGLSNEKEKIAITIKREGKDLEKILMTKPGWKISDISWRASTWNLPPRLGMWTPLADPKTLRESGLPSEKQTVFFKWINRKMETGNAAWKAGLRTGDILTKVNGKEVNFKPNKFHTYIKLNFKPGDDINFEVFRKGDVKKITFKLFK